MKKLIIPILFIAMLPFASALGNIWRLHFSDGTTTINGTDICLSSGSCLSQSSGVYDLDISGDTGTGAITNAETLVFQGGESINTTVSGNTLTINYNGTGESSSITMQEINNSFDNFSQWQDTYPNIDTDSTDDLDVSNLDNGSIIRSHNTSWKVNNATHADSASILISPIAITNVSNLTSSKQCTGTNKVNNVTITVDGIQINCAADQTGGGGGAGDKWIDDGSFISPNSTYAPTVNASKFTAQMETNITREGVVTLGDVNSSNIYATLIYRAGVELSNIYQAIGSYVTNAFLDTNYYNKTQENLARGNRVNVTTQFAGDVTGTYSTISITKNYNTSTEIANVKVNNATHSDSTSSFTGTITASRVSDFNTTSNATIDDRVIATFVNNLFVDDLSVDDDTPDDDSEVPNDISIASTSDMNTTGNFNVNKRFNVSASTGNAAMDGNLSWGGGQAKIYWNGTALRIKVT